MVDSQRLTLLSLPIFKRAYDSRVLSVHPDKLIGAWTFGDLTGSGVAANSITTAYPATEMLLNGDFETAGDFTYWSKRAGTGAIADEGTLVHAGSHAAKITAGASADTWIYSTFSSNPRCMNVRPGWTVTITFWTRGDGTNAGRYALQNSTSGAYIRSLITTNITGTTYTQFTASFTIPANCFQVALYLACPAANGGIAYFDDVSLTTTYTLDAWIYNGSASVTFGQTGIGDGKTSALFNGAVSGLVLGNVAYNSVFNGDVGSCIAWGKVNAAANWTDVTAYRYLWHPKSRPYETVYLCFGHNQTAHGVAWRRRVVAAEILKTYTFSPSGPLGWFCMGFRWDMVSATKNIAGWIYAPGHTGFTKVFDEEPATGNESWNKTTYPVDGTNALLAGGGANGQLWVGYEAHCYQWAGVALTDAEMRRAMVP